MHVEVLNKRYEIPEDLIASYKKNYETLPGSGQRDSVLYLRNVIAEVFDYLAEDPEAIDEHEYRHDFINAMAMYEALSFHGLLHDS